MSLLNIFQSKSAADAAPNKPQIARAAAPTTPAATPTGTTASAAPTTSNRAGSPANPDAAAAVKSVLSAFAEEASEDARKIALITQQLSTTQAALLNAAGPRDAHAANARAREEIKGILGELHAFHGECSATATQLQQMSK